MNRLKDLIYNKNDVLIALVIVLVAGFVIFDRIGVIMDYPSMLTAQAAEQNGEVVPETPGNDGVDLDPETPVSDDPGSEDPVTDGEEPAVDPPAPDPDPEQTTGEPAVQQVSVYIEYGVNGSQIAQLLVDAGLLENTDAFYTALSAAGADTKLQAGSFKIPSNATPAEIIQIITN
ncbi:MAG: hypothetical protein CVU86_05080 [Firmicutes bacterium HGW-Firmicutes-11]|jgi:hypothetical protein|nr:MAG: hypothetical protein CVU86_05080 [Firmicutes bacterium HGW-Firmicutes-11]